MHRAGPETILDHEAIGVDHAPRPRSFIEPYGLADARYCVACSAIQRNLRAMPTNRKTASRRSLNASPE